MKKIFLEKKFKYILIFIFLLSIQFVIGSRLQHNGSIFNNFTDVITVIVEIMLITILLTFIYYLIIYVINKIKKLLKLDPKATNNKIDEILNNKKLFYICFAFIVICWIPAFVAFCPGMFNYDGPTQVKTFLTDYMGTDNPIIHTLIISGFYVLGSKCFGDSTIGMLLYTIFQMLVMAAIFSYSIKFINKEYKNKYLTIFSIIFFALFPLNQLLPLMTTKDTLFAGFTLLFIIYLYKLIKNEEINYVDCILFVIFSNLSLLFRINAIYAYLAIIPFIFVTKNKKIIIKILSLFLISLFIYNLLDNLLIYTTRAEKKDDITILPFTLQSIGRTVKYDGANLTETEKEKILYYFKYPNRLKYEYNPAISDNVFYLINKENIKSNKEEYYKTIFNLFINHPKTCIDASLDTVRGYWYVNDDSFMQLHHDKNPNLGALEMDSFKNDEFITHDYNLSPNIRSIYKNLFSKNGFKNIPILYLTFQPATYFYLVIACLLSAIYYKNKKNILIIIYFLIYFATCFLGPCGIIRYVYCVIVATPILISMFIKNDKKKEEIN